ncbi:hypothetical protein [Oricola cellulosilytica]|uniref:DUF2946 domain-containing protein n=1 Tax=Oricola cellulosilytica TaxID=1429082 RepID=A0A4R0PDP2_9HYPH|nr:hypothetical protein [Oricola cellulosilytica]TCD15416.1 hypothetical protein E0D97_07760 [Oricola cellulosilytica]
MTEIFHPGRLAKLFALAAMLSLLFAGGLFAHADEFADSEHTHIGTLSADHGHGDRNDKSADFSDVIHCGSTTLHLCEHLMLQHPKVTVVKRQPPEAQSTNGPGAVEPPPPRIS